MNLNPLIKYITSYRMKFVLNKEDFLDDFFYQLNKTNSDNFRNNRKYYSINEIIY